MARKVVVRLVDDFDSTTEADETTTFALDGASYEIDLSETNSTELRETVDQRIPYARIPDVRRTPPDVPHRSQLPHPRNLAAARKWASNNGHTVSTRGRISAEIIAAYEAASA